MHTIAEDARVKRSHIFLVAAGLIFFGIVLGLVVSVFAFLLLGVPGMVLFVAGLVRKDPFVPGRRTHRRRRQLHGPPEPADTAGSEESPFSTEHRHQQELTALREQLAGEPLSSIRFVGPGNSLSVAGYRLESPLIYVADCESLPGADASLLCLQRRIDPPLRAPKSRLCYWPHLSHCSSAEVGAYVEWLAQGRSKADIDIGYVFIYFYGLERRAIVDGMDAVPIAQEVARLLEIYGSARSFRGYASRLINHLVMIRRLKPTTRLIAKLISLQGNYCEPEFMILLLGYLAREHQPLVAEWAFLLAGQDERARRSVVTDRAPKELCALFTVRYQERFGSGIVPILDESTVTVPYRAASPSLLQGSREWEKIPVAHWPGIRDWRREFAHVVELWNQCIEDLRTFARRSDKTSPTSTQAYEALPEELRRETDHPLQPKWDQLLSGSISQSGVQLLPVSSIASLRGITEQQDLTLGQSRDLAELVAALGSALEPDARYTSRAYSFAEYVAVLRLPDPQAVPKDQNYLLASMLLRLALEVANADGSVDQDERRVMKDFILEHIMLNRNEQLRLQALIEVLLKNDTSLAGLKKLLLTKFNESQRAALGDCLVALATACHAITLEETFALERSYRSLGLDPSGVRAQLGKMGLAGPERPILVAKAEREELGERIPPPYALDLDLIRKKRSETEDAVKMLLEFMPEREWDNGGDGDAAAPASVAVANNVGVHSVAEGFPALSSLAAAVRNMVLELVTRDTWSRTDFYEVVRKHGRSPAAAVEEINTWSDEALGDFLIVDNGDTATIRRDLWDRRSTK